MELVKPDGVPPDLWEQVLAHQKEAMEFEERKSRLLSSFKDGDEKMLDRALHQLQADEDRLSARQVELCEEMRAHGVDI